MTQAFVDTSARLGRSPVRDRSFVPETPVRHLLPPAPLKPMAPAQLAPAAVAPSPELERRRLGQSDLQVFPIALGGNVFGWVTNNDSTTGVLDSYAAAGGNFLDTADSYSFGRSEIMIGDWMRDNRNRAQMVVSTKVGKSANNGGVHARAIIRSVDESLMRLGTDYIDLLYLHIDDDTVPFEETLVAVNDLICSGKVRHFGASNHTANRLIEARVITAQLGATPMIALQQHYNLINRTEFEGDVARVASQQRLAIMPRFALASGFLSGKYRSRLAAYRGPRGREIGKMFNRRGVRILSCLDQIAAEHQVQVASVALAWLLAKPGVVAPVVSATSAEQVADLVAAASIRLTRAQVASLDRASE